MKSVLVFPLALAAAICVTGCYTPQGQNAAGGAVLGGATGAARTLSRSLRALRAMGL